MHNDQQYIWISQRSYQFWKIKNFKYLSDESWKNVYFIIWFKILFIRYGKRGWEQFFEITFSLFWDTLCWKWTCVQMSYNVILIAQQEKVLLFSWINRSLYLFAQVFSLSHLIRECTLLHWHWHNIVTICCRSNRLFLLCGNNALDELFVFY